MSCARAPAEDVHMHSPVLLSGLRAFGRRGVVQRPVAGLEVIDAAAIELRQHIDHRAADRADQEAPVRELDRRELALLPDRARGIDDEMAAILAVEKYGLRHHDAAARAFVQNLGHGPHRYLPSATQASAVLAACLIGRFVTDCTAALNQFAP